jgi:hypothetical protein
MEAASTIAGSSKSVFALKITVFLVLLLAEFFDAEGAVDVNETYRVGSVACFSNI